MLLCRHLCCDSSQTQMEWMAGVFIAQVRALFPVVPESVKWGIRNGGDFPEMFNEFYAYTLIYSFMYF